MHFHSWIVDNKIHGLNVAVDVHVKEYAELAAAVLKKNDLQRRRVQSVTRPYELLRRDLIDGCVIPPLILAVTEQYSEKVQAKIDACVNNNATLKDHQAELEQFVLQAVGDRELIILDGMQRTYTIQQALDDTRNRAQLEAFMERPLRLEIYIGLRKLGLLYRMLTLNTGQIPMSFRHQIEIMYHDYLDTDALPNNIRVTREVEGSRARGLGNYRYQDVVDMFYAYTTGNPQTLDRPALVGQLKELDFLETYQPKKDDDLRALLVLYDTFVKHLAGLAGEWHYTFDPDVPMDNARPSIERPFGADVASLFCKSQPMTGFGAECHRLLQKHVYNSFQDIAAVLQAASFAALPPSGALDQLLAVLDEIASKAKRIGDAQRAYFQFAFRILLTPDLFSSFKDLSKCWLEAQQQYELAF